MATAHKTEQVTLRLEDQRGQILARDVAMAMQKMPNGWRLADVVWTSSRLVMTFANDIEDLNK